MSGSRAGIAERLMELRQRHFGPRGKPAFAAQLGIDLPNYERFERGAMPPADLLLRACELTGEDLQWLLTGVAARGTVVISGARARHQEVLGRVAQLLERRPAAARQIESFIALLEHQPAPQAAVVEASESTEPRWIPLFRGPEAPRSLPTHEPETARALPAPESETLEESAAELTEIAFEFSALKPTHAAVLTVRSAGAAPQRWLRAPGFADFVPQLFAVEIADDRLAPMLGIGEAALVSARLPAEIGAPVLCRIADEAVPRSGVWLGESEGLIHIGRLDTRDREAVASESVEWSLKILFRVKWAA